MPNTVVYSRDLIGCTIKDPTITVERSPRGLYISARFRLQISVKDMNSSARFNKKSETDHVNKHNYERHAHFLHEIRLEYSKKGFEDIITTYFPEQISTAEVRRTVQTRRGWEVGGVAGVAGSVPTGTIRFTVTRDTTIAQEVHSPAWVLSDSESDSISTLSFIQHDNALDFNTWSWKSKPGLMGFLADEVRCSWNRAVTVTRFIPSGHDTLNAVLSGARPTVPENLKNDTNPYYFLFKVTVSGHFHPALTLEGNSNGIWPRSPSPWSPLPCCSRHRRFRHPSWLAPHQECWLRPRSCQIQVLHEIE
jgi:hypothetical protein